MTARFTDMKYPKNDIHTNIQLINEIIINSRM